MAYRSFKFFYYICDIVSNFAMQQTTGNELVHVQTD